MGPRTDRSYTFLWACQYDLELSASRPSKNSIASAGHPRNATEAESTRRRCWRGWEPKGYGQGVEAIPLKTDLLGPGDDIVNVARRALDAAGLVPATTDILAIAESPLAITQGRIVDIDTVRPSVLARIFCRFFDFDSSLSTPYAAQVAMNEVGTARFVLAFILAAPTRLLGRHGD